MVRRGLSSLRRWWLGCWAALLDLGEDFGALHALFEGEDWMVGGHGVDEQELLQRIPIAEFTKVTLAPAVEGAEELIDTRATADADEGEVEGHLPADLHVSGLARLTGGNVRRQLCGIINTELNPSQLLRVSPAQLL